MTGHSLRGHMGFVPKEGTNFDTRLNVRLHSDELVQINARKGTGESAADWIRRAIRKELLREAEVL